MDKKYKIHDKYLARSILIVRGPFTGKRGTVQMGYDTRVKVAFADRTDQLWFQEKDIKLIGCCK